MASDRPKPTPLVLPICYTVPTAAKAMDMTEAGIRRLVKEGVIPAVRFGDGTLRIPVRELRRAVARKLKEGQG